MLFGNRKPIETDYLDIFRDNLVELKKMRQLAREIDDTNLKDIVSKIDTAQTFSEVYKTMEKYIADPIIQKIGRSGLQTIFYMGSFVSKESHFHYYAAHFLDKMIKEMNQRGYPVLEDNKEQVFNI